MRLRKLPTALSIFGDGFFRFLVGILGFFLFLFLGSCGVLVGKKRGRG